MPQGQTSGDLLRAALKDRKLGNRTFARILAGQSGRNVDDERRDLVKRLSGQYFQKPTAERYAQALDLPPDYFPTSAPRPAPSRQELSEVREQAAELLRRVDDLEQRFDEEADEQ